MTNYRIDIQVTPRFVLASVSGDFPGVEEARAWWHQVAITGKSSGLRKVMFVRYGGRPPDAVAMVDTIRSFQSLDMRDWRVAIVFWDATQIVEEFQFVTALARALSLDLLVCDTVSTAEAFLDGVPLAAGNSGVRFIGTSGARRPIGHAPTHH